jgi:rhamnogalacturonyl hydrolase YesR
LGIPLVAPVFLSEIFFPSLRKAFVTKKRFPIADAHFILAFLNLYEITNKQEYLREAQNIATELLKSSVPGFSGNTWGYPFDWMTTRGLWTSGIPLITTTGYCFEAFLKLYDVTLEGKYFDIAHSIFQFTLNDLSDTAIDKDTAACSYSPVDNSQIVNANAYRSYVLMEGSLRFNNKVSAEKATLNINFILKNQNADGSWKYAVNDERDNFVDNFHTCFVLKNLLKINKIKKDEKISFAVKKGYSFYKNNLIDSTKRPLPFAKLSRLNIVKREMYDYAEGISLGLLMQNQDEEAKNIVNEMVGDLVNKYQNEDGSFITRVSLFDMENKIPYLRWPQSQLFYALTNYLKTE